MTAFLEEMKALLGKLREAHDHAATAIHAIERLLEESEMSEPVSPGQEWRWPTLPERSSKTPGHPTQCVECGRLKTEVWEPDCRSDKIRCSQNEERNRRCYPAYRRRLRAEKKQLEADKDFLITQQQQLLEALTRTVGGTVRDGETVPRQKSGNEAIIGDTSLPHQEEKKGDNYL